MAVCLFHRSWVETSYVVQGSEMRGLAVAAGGLLLLGGMAMVVVADHERVDGIAAIDAEIARLERALSESRSDNLELAKELTALRSLIAEQDAKIADTTGFLK